MNKRYDWKGFLDDAFVKNSIKIYEKDKDKDKEKEKINNNTDKENNNLNSLIKFDDEKIEKLADLLKEKSEFNISFFSNLLEDQNLELSYLYEFLKEIIILIELNRIEIKLLIDLLIKKNEGEKEKEKDFTILELNLIAYEENIETKEKKISNGFCIFEKEKELKELKDNYKDNHNGKYITKGKFYINFENPSFVIILKNLNKLQEELNLLSGKFSEKNNENNNNIIIEKDKDKENKYKYKNENENENENENVNNDNNYNTIDDKEYFSYIKNKNQNQNLFQSDFANLEKLFLIIVENIMVLIMRKDYKDAKKELIFANYVLENIIFMRIKLNCNKNFTEFGRDIDYKINEEDKFLKILDFLNNDNEYDNQDNHLDINKDKEKENINKPFDKNDSNNVNIEEKNKKFSEKFIIFSFLGGFFEKLYQQRIINFEGNYNNQNDKFSENENSNPGSNQFNKEIIDENIMNLICFYKDLIKMNNECEENM